MSFDTPTKTLLGQMLNLPLFVATRHPLNLDKFSSLLNAHLQWAIAAEQRGVLFASGPFAGDSQCPGELGGMSIIRAQDVNQAMSIIDADPFISEGVYGVTVKKWVLMEGAFQLTISCSDQRFTLS